MEIAAAPRSGAVVARLDAARRAARRRSRSARSTSQVDYGERVAIARPQRQRQDDAARRRCSAGSRSTPATRALGPGVVVGELDQARAAFAGDGPLLARFEAATGLRAERGPLAARQVRPRRRPRRPARPTRSRPASAPGRRSRCCSARGVNCLVLDEPTNHLDLPAIEQLEQALDGFAGTVLLVTHDRALLDAVTLTRRVELVDGRIVSDEPARLSRVRD